MQAFQTEPVPIASGLSGPPPAPFELTAPTELSLPPEDPPGLGARAVVYTEDAADGRLLALALQHGGYQPEVAGSLEALLKLTAAPRLALVIVDTSPRPQRACELLARLRAQEQLAAVPVILLSSQSDPRIMAQAFDQGADDFIVKPIHLSVFLQRAQALIRRQQRVLELQRQLCHWQDKYQMLCRSLTPGAPAEAPQPRLTPGYARLC